MSIILAGDTHGLLDIGKITEYFEANDDFNKEDYLIILGDVGVLWNEAEDQDVQQIFNNLPLTTLWIDGNHDNFDLLESYPDEVWHGGRVHFISDSIIHLARGQVFEIDGLTIFTFGGGNSIDKGVRQPGLSWWPEEMPSDFEYEEGLRNLEKIDWKVDYVLTHTCPEFIANELVTYLYPGEEALQRYFNRIAENLEFEEWFFGHWHIDESIDNFRCLYNDLVELN